MYKLLKRICMIVMIDLMIYECNVMNIIYFLNTEQVPVAAVVARSKYFQNFSPST